MVEELPQGLCYSRIASMRPRAHLGLGLFRLPVLHSVGPEDRLSHPAPGKAVMGTQMPPESLHRVFLSFDGHEYSATIWRGGGFQWRLLSVEVPAAGCRDVVLPDFESCRLALHAAEEIAREILEGRSGA